MFQRCVAISVLVGLLASQLARIPHAHAWASASHKREHDAHPHVHLGWTDHHHHSHEHGHSHAGHTRDRVADVLAATVNKAEFTERIHLSAEHDSAAVFIPCSAASTATRGEQARVAATVQALVANVYSLPCCLHGVRRDDAPFHPPNSDVSDGKLFLKLRTLRI